MTKENTALQDFLAAKKVMKNPAFNATNPHFKNKFADLKAVAEAANNCLLEFNIIPMQELGYVQVGERHLFGIATTLKHVSGETVAYSFYPINDQLDDQKKGSAITYGRRYGLAATCGLVAEPDDDGNEASKPDYITDAQRGELQTLLEQTGSDVRLFCQHMKIDSLNKMQKSAFNTAYNLLMAKLEKQNANS